MSTTKKMGMRAPSPCPFRPNYPVSPSKGWPSGLFVSVEEPGVCVGAPPKEIRLAETQTVLKGESPEQAIRTIVCREIAPGPKKDRWHPLYTTGALEPADVVP